MATYPAIASISQAIIGILADGAPQPEFASARFELFQVDDWQQSTPLDEGVSLYLYSVTMSPVQRNLRVTRSDPKRPPLPLDLHYVLTAWGRTAIVQQRLLGWSARALADLPVLNAGLLNHYGRPERAFGDGEYVDLVPEALSMQDMTHVWDLLKPNAACSLTYVARMVYIESVLEDRIYDPIQTRLFDYEKAES